MLNAATPQHFCYYIDISTTGLIIAEMQENLETFIESSRLPTGGMNPFADHYALDQARPMLTRTEAAFRHVSSQGKRLRAPVAGGK